MWRRLAVLAGLVCAAVGMFHGLSGLRRESDALAARQFQEQQRLVARLAAERMRDLLTGVRLRLEALPPPADPAGAAPDWMSAPALAQLGATAFLHDAEGRVLAVAPDAPPERAAALRAHRHLPPDGAWTDRSLCAACLEHGRALGVGHPLDGHPGLFVGAAVDEHRLHRQLFASLSDDHDAYVWVMRDDGAIVSSPDPAVVGLRPFEGLQGRVRDTLAPVVAAMRAGESGTGDYVWRDDDGERHRLVAYTPLPGWPGLSVAHSADRTSVTARTTDVHAAAGTTLAVLLTAFTLLAASIAVGARRQARVEREARERLAAAQERMLRMERLSTVGQLAAGVGHEIKNPLAFVRANIEALQMVAEEGTAPLDAGEVREMLDEMRIGVDRVTAVVSALGGVGRVNAEPRPIDLRQPLDTALLLARPHLKGRLALDLDLDRALPVQGVPGDLAQVFLNLVVNAAQACTAGGRPGRLRIAGAVDAGRARLSVSDDGPGIPPEVRARIFEPFFTTKPEGEGTGLGLAIAREIAERHGGALTFETGSGGTTFTVTLPALGAQAEAGSEPLPEIGAWRRTWERLRAPGDRQSLSARVS